MRKEAKIYIDPPTPKKENPIQVKLHNNQGKNSAEE